MPLLWHDGGMVRVRISTTVDQDLLARARALAPGTTDASVVEAALESLLRSHREAEVDAAYEAAYVRTPLPTTDEWGDLETFLDAASRT